MEALSMSKLKSSDGSCSAKLATSKSSNEFSTFTSIETFTISAKPFDSVTGISTIWTSVSVYSFPSKQDSSIRGSVLVGSFVVSVTVIPDNRATWVHCSLIFVKSSAMETPNAIFLFPEPLSSPTGCTILSSLEASTLNCWEEVSADVLISSATVPSCSSNDLLESLLNSLLATVLLESTCSSMDELHTSNLLSSAVSVSDIAPNEEASVSLVAFSSKGIIEFCGLLPIVAFAGSLPTSFFPNAAISVAGIASGMITRQNFSRKSLERLKSLLKFPIATRYIAITSLPSSFCWHHCSRACSIFWAHKATPTGSWPVIRERVQGIRAAFPENFSTAACSSTSDDNSTGGREYLMMSDEQPLRQCEMETFKSSGPGGQHRNKRESVVRLMFSG
nr:Peptide chain release factor 2 [Ipomoea batatas]